MCELAILMLVVDRLRAEPAPAEQAELQPAVIYYDPGQGADWHQVKQQLASTGAVRVLLQFSNETVILPAHSYQLLDINSARRYRRLYPVEDVLAWNTPLSSLELLALHPLPEIRIQSRPIEMEQQQYDLVHVLYYFESRQWEKVEQWLAANPAHRDHPFFQACFYSLTNRPEDACEASTLALTQTSPLPSGNQSSDPGLLWMVHGLHCARSGRPDEAAAAFRLASGEDGVLAPLYWWADDRMQQGKTGEELIRPIEQWLTASPGGTAKTIRVLHRAGLYQLALDRLDRLSADASTDTASLSLLTPLRFECLIHTKQLALAVLLYHEHPQCWSSGQARMDGLICRLILADGKAASLAQIINQLVPGEADLLQERAVSLGLFREAEALSPYLTNPLSLAFFLFRSGYVLRAAGHFLQAMKKGSLDSAGYRCLGDILYYRKAYVQASGIYEYLLAQTPEDPALRSALALACLRQSEELLEESIHIFPSSMFLKEEANKVAEGILRMEASDALTRWHWAERNHFHE